MLVLMHSQLSVRVHHPAAVAARVEEHSVLVLALHVVEHVALELAQLATDAALPALEAGLHHARHVRQERSISLPRRWVRGHGCKQGSE